MDTLWYWVVLVVTVFLTLCLPGLLWEFYKQIKKDFFNEGKGSDLYDNDKENK